MSCSLMPALMPTQTASWPEHRWQNPRIAFSLYREAAAVSRRLVKNKLHVFDQKHQMSSHLMVVMSLKYLSASSLETEVESAGPWSRMCSLGGLRSKVASETEELSRLLPPNRND